MRVVALAGGTGGAKLADGLQAVLPPGDLTVVVNTGDDTERHGLLVMPDHDAVMYMLAGRFDYERGWGQAGETLGGDGRPGRARRGGLVPARRPRLRDAHRADGADPRGTCPDRGGRHAPRGAWASGPAILPMADGPVRTQVRTDDGLARLPGVLRPPPPGAGGPRGPVRGSTVEPTPQVVEAIEAADVVVIGPSNPIVSIGPILAGPDPRRWSRRGPVPASRSWPSARSSAASRSRARPTGCWSRSVTNRARSGWPGSTATSPRRSSSTPSTRRSSPTSRPSGCGPTSPTRSWPTLPAGRGSPGAVLGGRGMTRVAAIIPVGTLDGRQVAARRIARRRGAPRPRRGVPRHGPSRPRWPSTGSPTSS